MFTLSIRSTPAMLAFILKSLAEVMTEITHTPKDKPKMVDAAKLVVAQALQDLLLSLAYG
jgi:hypothetical protein